MLRCDALRQWRRESRKTFGSTVSWLRLLMVDYIAELQAAILNLHGCESKYLETVPVTEEFNGETIWQGEVEVFELKDHPKAKRAYAWGHVTGDNDQARRYV